MTTQIAGKSGFAEIFITDDWYELFCFKSCELNISDEEIEKTGATSSRSREFTVGFGSAVFRASGVTTIDNTDKISILWLLQHRTDVHELRINLTSTGGGTQQITFFGIMRETALTNDVTSWSQSSVEFRITRDITPGDVVSPPSPESIFSDYWETTPGATAVTGLSVEHSYDLIGLTLISAYREGTEHDPVDSGVPGNRECRYVDPEVRFDPTNPFNSGERVFLVFTR